MKNTSLKEFDYWLEKSTSDACCKYDFEDNEPTEEELELIKADKEWEERKYKDF